MYMCICLVAAKRVFKLRDKGHLLLDITLVEELLDELLPPPVLEKLLSRARSKQANEPSNHGT